MFSPASPRHILLLLGWYYPDSIGGTERYTQTLARDLRELGYRITIAAPSVDDRERHYEYNGTPVYRYPINVTPTTSEVRGATPPQHFSTFTQWLEGLCPDLVHMHSFTRGCGFFHAQYVKSLGLPLCTTVHVPSVTCARGTMQRWGQVTCDGEMRRTRCTACVLHGKGVPRLVSHLAAWLPLCTTHWAVWLPNRFATGLSMAALMTRREEQVRGLFSLVDRVIVVAQWLYDVLRRNGIPEEKLILSRHGISDEECFPCSAHEPQRNVGGPCFGYVGRFHPTKGVHLLIDAVKRLPASLPLTLQLYGTASGQEEQTYLSALRLRAGEDRRITFMGEVTEENHQVAFGSFDVLAVPSTWLETGPFVVLEAFAAGIPVVGSDTGGIAELVTPGESGLLVRSGSVKAWTHALHDMIERWEHGAWTWRLPSVRKSWAVALDMQRVYESVWAGGTEKR